MPKIQVPTWLPSLVCVLAISFAIRPLQAQQTSTICSFNHGPRAGTTHDYAPKAPLPVGSPCNDGIRSSGVIVSNTPSAPPPAPDDNSAALSEKILTIRPAMQKTGSWCWLATGEMLFRYYGVPSNHPTDFQCGEARGQGAVPTGSQGQSAFSGPCWANCYACGNVGAGTIRGIYNLITQYPQIVSRTAGNTRLLQAKFSTTALPIASVEAQIDAGHPIAAGISPNAGFLPPGVSEHAILIVGYDSASSTLTVNDPFPYQTANMQPAYLRYGGREVTRGQFKIPYSALVGPLKWENTVFDVH